MSINKAVITGNLTRDPELRSTQSGMNILTFGVAVNDRRRNQQTGEWEDYANFIDCVLFGARAEYLSRTLRKGIRVAVEGKLHWSSWERDGQRRTKIEVYVDDIDFISPRQQSGYGTSGMDGQQQAPSFSAPSPAPTYAAPQQRETRAPQRPAQTPPQVDDVYDEDIPF